MEKKHMKEFYTVPGRQLVDPEEAIYYEFKDILYPYHQIKEFPLHAAGIRRFLPLLPIADFRVNTEGLGDTPLMQAENLGRAVGLNKLLIKREDLNPTGCFKDRESGVMISKVVEDGLTQRVYVVSSGNAALSTAFYANQAGLRCTCYIPEKTTPEKQELILRYGAELKKVPGFYEDVYRTVAQLQPLGVNVTSGQNRYRIEGGKTMAYEIWEQLGQSPDVVVIPSGNGGCLAATWKGFVELQKLGKIKNLPQMVCVQIKGAAPIKVALEKRLPFVRLGEIDDSVAEGIVAQESYNSPQAVQALIESGGYVVEVADREIIKALRLIIETEGIYPEPTSAAAVAALSKLRSNKNAQVVMVNTGDGKKMMGEIQHVLQQGEN